MPPFPAAFYDAPKLNPSPYGLIPAARPMTEDEARRIGAAGVMIRPVNCDTGFGTWDISEPCWNPAEPDAVKTGERAEASGPFLPVVPWAYDECDPGEPVADIIARAEHTLALQEPVIVESAFATVLLADATAAALPGTIPTRPSAAAALGYLEDALGEAGYLGFIHAAPRWAGRLKLGKTASATKLTSPLGHQYVFGGGYGPVLGDTLVATGQVMIWRPPPLETKTALDPDKHVRYAVAERSVVVAYECLVAAVTIDEE